MRTFARGAILDFECGASADSFYAHSYIRLDFGTDEEKAQARRGHQLDGWRQAFRLDKKAAVLSWTVRENAE